MRKCGFHVQATSPQLREAIDAVQPTVIASLAHDRDFWWGVKNDHPGIFLIGRRYEEGVPWWARNPGGWAEQCAALEMPYDAFITDNEPRNVYNEITMETAAQHDDWCCAFRERILEFGYEAVALNVPTGHFHRNAVVNLFPNVCQTFRYIGLHEYSARAMWDQDPTKKRPIEDVPRNEGDIIGRWYCQRYRDWHDGIVQRWPEREGKFQMVATECGVAMGVIPGFGDVGWATDLSVDQYMASLRWYFGEMNQDDYCLGGAIFMMGFADHEWASFETLPFWEHLLEIPEVAAPEPPPDDENGGNEMGEIRVVDLEYKERDFEYAKSKYGVAFRRAEVAPGQKVYRLVELWEKTGDTSLIQQVLSEDGSPMANVDVAFYWPGAPDPPDPPTEVTPHDWHRNFVHGLTNAEGEVGPSMGHGAYHGEGEGGPHAVWVRDPDIPSDICEKLGMLAGTFHDHLDQKFQLMTEGEEPGNGEEPGVGKFQLTGTPTFEVGPTNKVIIYLAPDHQERDFYETRADICVTDRKGEMIYWESPNPVMPASLAKYECQTEYTPGEGETERFFYIGIRDWTHPSKERIGWFGPFAYVTGQKGTWWAQAVWTKEEAPPSPPPSGDLEERLAALEQLVADIDQSLADLQADIKAAFKAAADSL